MAGQLRRFEDKVVLITGATRGIGLATAERLGKEGGTVVICSRQKENVDEAVAKLKSQGINVHGIVCHVGTAEQRKKLIAETVAKYKRIDVLVSNVAVNPVMGPMLDATTEQAWDKIFDVNVKSHFFLIKEALPYMPKGSSIIIVSSYAGYLPSPILGAYSVSKTALLGLTKVLARELAPRGIRVNCLAPGVIKTKFSEALWKDEEIAELQMKDIPLQRFGTSEECAGAVAFLGSSDADYITGETVLAAGGIHARL